MSTSSPIIEFSKVNKWYGEFHVLTNINLNVRKGEGLRQVLTTLAARDLVARPRAVATASAMSSGNKSRRVDNS
ncbi:MAG: hypothetical protein EBW58_10820 [Betaproteobacteria bacterium]|nr:hypothetical protein [Betaproteobacteria bacterium]